jgi:3-polyprenyl-4-hydroxybenzoate decarboxylase
VLGLDHYVKVVAVLPYGTDLSESSGVLAAIAQRCDFISGSEIDVIGTSYHHLLDPSSVIPGVSSKMIIDASGPVKSQKTKVDVSKTKAIGGVDKLAFLSKDSTALCALIPSDSDLDADWVLKEPELSGSRMFVLVDDDIEVRDGRQVLWAMATRFQPAEGSVIKDGRMVVDARKGDEWTALRATLPFDKRP